MARRILTGAIALTFLTSCYQSDPASETYVVVDPERSDDLIKELTRAAAQSGLAPYSRRLEFQNQNPMYAFEAEGHHVRIWAQNMPFNSLADKRCSELGDTQLDPGQFVIAVESRMPAFTKSRVASLRSVLRERLTAAGYQIYDKPLACSILTKPEMDYGDSLSNLPNSASFRPSPG